MHHRGIASLRDQANRLAAAECGGDWLLPKRERAWRVHTPRSVRRIVSRRGAVGVVSLIAAGALLGVSGSAAAFPQPTIAQVQHRLAELNSRASRLGQQYDEVLQELTVANQRLKLLTKETAGYRASFDGLRAEIGRIAAVDYEQGGVDSPVALLTSGSPQEVLSQSSILTELSSVNDAQLSQYLAASRQLVDAQQAASRVQQGIEQLKHSLGKRLAVLNTLKSQEETLLAELTPAQKSGVGPGGSGGGNGGGGNGGGGVYHGPTGTQAQKAVAYAYGRIGCAYVWGGVGPCGAGYDCSGLMMSAWAYAGIQIPRISNDQIDELPGVPLHTSSGAFTTAYLEPGDILGFAGNSHVGMYVGNGYLIDAPVPGAFVEKVQLAGWYLQELDGAVRP
jgi:cell wall-associated NlpC family hydrolase